MKALYVESATATGGREGQTALSDGSINLDLTMPGSGKQGANPEQLFAMGYAACFDGAFNLLAQKQKLDVESQTKVDVSLNQVDDGFAISAKIAVTVSGIDQQTAQELLEKTHQFCPYSKAINSNIDVELDITVK